VISVKLLSKVIDILALLANLISAQNAKKNMDTISQLPRLRNH